MNKSTTVIERPIGTAWMIILTILVGIVGGYGAILFRAMIGLVHNLFFEAQWSLNFNANLHASTSTWGWGVIFIPVIGSVIVNWITNTFAPEARGHGVPEVMDAIYYNKGRIRPVVSVVKAIASAISIGTGGSVGREGPIIQIGSAFGSSLGQLMHISPRQRIILIAAGAGAGIAATFNAPIGGLAFAVELMLVAINAFSVTMVAIATVIATFIGRFYLGNMPSFDVPSIAGFSNHVLPLKTLLLFVPFGVLMGAASALFIRTIYWAEDFFEAVFKNTYIRHALGMFFLGIVFYLFMRFSGHYYVDGVGYATILDVLKGLLSNPWFLLLLFAAKLLSTCLTLGSGASGGIFSPSLFLGATLGAFFATLLNYIGSHMSGDLGFQVNVILFAIAGMASMVSGATGAVITAITMTIEQTRDYADIVPITISVALAYAVRVKITAESIYTLKLSRRGHALPQGLQAAIFSARKAKEQMEESFVVYNESEAKNVCIKRQGKENPAYVLVENEGLVKGMIRQDLTYFMPEGTTQMNLNQHVQWVYQNTPWPDVLRLMKEDASTVILVAKKEHSEKLDDLIGVITAREVTKAAKRSAELVD